MGELQIKDAALAVPPCQGGCREFESRLPLHFLVTKWPLVNYQGPLFCEMTPVLTPIHFSTG